MESSEKKDTQKKAEPRKTVKILFGIRVCLWAVAAGFTIHWIYWSFHLYEIGIHIVEDYGKALRPILYKDLIVSVICVLISFKLRSISDKIKKQEENNQETR